VKRTLFSSSALILLLASVVLSFGVIFYPDPVVATNMKIILTGVWPVTLILIAVAISKSSTIYRPSRVTGLLLGFGILFGFSMTEFLILLFENLLNLALIEMAMASLCAIIILLWVSEKVLYKCSLCGIHLKRARIRIHTLKYATLCADCWASKVGAIIDKHPISDNESVLKK